MNNGKTIWRCGRVVTLACCALGSTLIARAGLAEGKAAWAAGNVAQAAAEFTAVAVSDPGYVEARVNLAFARLALLAADPAVAAEAYRWGIVLSANPADMAATTAEVRWETYAPSAWSYSADGGQGGGDAVRSGRSRHWWGSVLAADFTGPGTVSFHWRLDDPAPVRDIGLFRSEAASGWVAVDNKTQGVYWIGANSEATVSDLYIGEGTHRIYWVFYDPTDSAQTDAALYVDQVMFTPEEGGVEPPPEPSGTGLGAGADSGVAFINDGQTDRPVFDQPTGSELQQFLRETLVPRLAEVEAALAAYTEEGPGVLALDWSGAQWLPGGLAGGVYRFDVGDAYALRAALAGLVGGLQVLPDRWELGAVPLVQSVMGPLSDGTTLAGLLAGHASLFTPRAGASPSGAVAKLDAGLALLREASAVIGAREPSVAAEHLVPAEASFSPFLFPANLLPGGAGWAEIDELVPAGASVATITKSFMAEAETPTLVAAPLFGSGLNLRALLPAVEGNSALLGGRPGNLATFADPTFGGLLPLATDAGLSETLAEDGAGFWTFERWRTYHGGAGTFADYIFGGRTPVDPEAMEIYFFPEFTWLSAYGEFRPGVGDHRLVGQTSVDLASWITGSGTVSENGYWYSYASREEPASRVFFRLKSEPMPWPTEPTGWTIFFEGREGSGMQRLVFTGPATVQWADMAVGGAVRGTYAARAWREDAGSKWVVRVEAPLPVQLEFGRVYSDPSYELVSYGTLRVVPLDDPLMLASDTALHLFDLIGYGAAVESEARTDRYEVDVESKTVTQTFVLVVVN